MKAATHWKRPWCWARLRAGGEENDRGWDSWVASLTQGTWVWANSRRWWRTEKSDVLKSMGSQTVGHDWVTEQQQRSKSLDLLWEVQKRDYLRTKGFPGGTSGKESESEVSQSCLTLCDPMDCSLQRSSIHGIIQARVPEWVAISYCRELFTKL